MKGNVLIENIDEQRDKWLGLRQNSISATDLPVIARKSKYKSPLDLWLEKTGRKPREEKPNAHMTLGLRMESVIADMYAMTTGVEVERANCLVQHPDYEWAVASPDYFLEEKTRILECKNVGHHNSGKWDNDSYPDEFHLQVVWQLACCGIESGTLAGLIGGSMNSFYTPEIPYNEDLFAIMHGLAEEFRNLVTSDTPPDVVSSDKDLILQYIARSEKRVRLQAEMQDAIEEYNMKTEQLSKLKEMEKAIRTEQDEAKSKIILAMGDATEGELGQFLVSLKKVERKGYYCQPSSYWNFKVKEIAA